jgi:molybdenum cofactor biosynthesis protein B
VTFREHEQAAEQTRPTVRCAVITLSDTRTEATDSSGQLIVDGLVEAGHSVVERQIIPDEPARLGPLLERLCAAEGVDAVLLTGGTGIGPRDSTYDVVSARLDKRLDGFGELFRMLSWQEIGPAAMLSRALGGVRNGRIVLSMPGSRNAVRLAMEKLILPELQHLVWEVSGRVEG